VKRVIEFFEDESGKLSSTRLGVFVLVWVTAAVIGWQVYRDTVDHGLILELLTAVIGWKQIAKHQELRLGDVVRGREVRRE